MINSNESQGISKGDWMKMKVLKISCNEWNDFSRDKRELSLYREHNAEILVMAKGGQDDKGHVEDVESFCVHRFSTRPLRGFVPTPVNRFVALFTWAFYARKFRADIISGHDIMGLFIGWLSSVMQPKEEKPILIYDAHEFEIGRSAKRARFQVFLIKHLERFLMKRSDLSMMVNDSIADEVQRIHRLKEKPIVVRNVPNYWSLDQAKVAQYRKMLREKLQVKPDAFLVSYHGAIVPDRGIEIILEAVSRLEDVYALVLGNGAQAYVTELRNLVERLGIKARVLFMPAVSIAELANYVAAVDVGFSIIQAVNKNHYLALPNKMFENIQSLTPVIASDFPEIGKLIREYGIGIAVNPENVDEIMSAILRLKTDRSFYDKCKQNLAKAKEELCWEVEKKVLADAFIQLIEPLQ